MRPVNWPSALAPLCALLLLTACPSEPQPEPEPEPVIEVTPLYDGATGWNDRVLDDGDTPLDATGAACPCGPQAGTCLQAGPLRALSLPDVEDCDGVEAVDSAGALDWICQEGDAPTRVVSNGLADDAGLVDLLDMESAAWKPLQLIVTVDGAELLRTDEAVWWTDPVEPLPDAEGVVMLDSPGTVYVLDQARNTAGVQIAADSISLVTVQDAPLAWVDAAPTCNGATGEVEGADTTCLVAAGGQSCLWIEGGYDGGEAERNVFLSDVHASTIWEASVLAGGDGVTLGQGASGNLVRHVWINGSSHDGLVLTEGATGNLAHGMLVDDVEWTAVILWSSDGNTFQSVSAEDSGWGWYLEDSHDNRMEGVWAYANDQEGFYLWGSTGNVIDDAETGWNGWSGYYLASESDDNLLVDVGSRSDAASGILIEDCTGTDVFVASVGNAAGAGVATWGSYETTLVGLSISNSEYDGLYGDNTVDVVVVDLVASNNNEDGVHFSDGTDGVTLLNILAVDNHDDGIELHNTQDGGTLGAVLANAVSAGNAGHGLNLDDSTGVVVADLAVFASGDHGIELEGMADVVFTGLLRVGDSGGLDCSVDNDVGLADDSCANTGDSDAALELGLDLTGAFTGPVLSGDIVNDDDSEGGAQQEDIDDWLGFESRYRAWGIEGDWPDPDGLTGRCEPGDSCQIRDWRVHTDTTILKNIHGEADHDIPCPASAHGDVAVTDSHGAPNTFLLHAVEVVLDEIGDDDGLCETGESCTYSPNQGAYQGEGAPNACTFTGGMVSDVEVLVFHANGAT